MLLRKEGEARRFNLRAISTLGKVCIAKGSNQPEPLRPLQRIGIIHKIEWRYLLEYINSELGIERFLLLRHLPDMG